MVDQTVCIIGGGPAGLMAAERLAQAGQTVALFDAMPSVGRKFLLAGKGGLNLTHSEPLTAFIEKFGPQSARFADLLAEFGPDALRAWANGLGIETFIGSSGRVFPKEFKAAPLMRAWVRRLRQLGVAFHPRCRWTGFDGAGGLTFIGPHGPFSRSPQAALLALGGASWPQLGSDGGWLPLLTAIGCEIAPLRPANCGFLVDWSPHMARHFGAPLKTIALSFEGRSLRGEAMIADYGLEGSAVYALSAALRNAIARDGKAVLVFDLKPDLDQTALAQRLTRPRGALSLSNWLRKCLALPPAAVGLLHEAVGSDLPTAPLALARLIKALPLVLTAPRPIAEAISTAGGVCFDQLTEDLMMKSRPGLFFAGEMLDWEAPTGGYLLTGCFASGVRAARGVLSWLNSNQDLV